MAPRIIGDHPLARDPSGKLRSRIGTVFPRSRTIVTLPGIHAMQRMAYLDLLAAERAAAGQPPMSREEESAEWEASVDLVFDEGDVLIRPDPENMPLAFEADEVLQEVIPKHRIKFLNVGNEKVRKAIERQGECWRIALLPRSLPEMVHMIAASKVAIGNREIYYYDRVTGTHFLTCQEFAGLESLDDAELRRHLIEIRDLSKRVQSAGDGRDPASSWPTTVRRRRLREYDFEGMDPRALRSVYDSLRREVRGGRPPRVPPRRPGERRVAEPHVRFAPRPGRRGRFRGTAAGHEFRVLHAGPVAARLPHCRGRVGLRPHSRQPGAAATAIPKSRPCATRSAGGSSSISFASTATWSTSTSGGSSVRSPAGPRSTAAATSTWPSSSSAASTRRS